MLTLRDYVPGLSKVVLMLTTSFKITAPIVYLEYNLRNASYMEQSSKLCNFIQVEQ